MEKWASDITQIKYAELGDSPAAVDRETGVMYVNPDFEGKLDEDQWYFIFLHELGHLKKQTKNELIADEWAHKQYLKEGRSLKKSVFALTDLLPGTKPEDLERVKRQLKRAEIADGKISNYTGMTSYQQSYKYYGGSKCDPDYSVYFIGNRKPAIKPSFDRNKLLNFGEYTAAGSVAGPWGTAAGAIADVASSAFGPSKQDADHTQVLFNNYMADPNNKRPKIFPTKAEMLAGNLSQSDKDGINASYNESTGTWIPASSKGGTSDWRGAVTGYDAQGNIMIATFKGSTEHYEANIGVKSQKVMSGGSQIMSQAAASITNVFKSASATTWIITAIVGVLIIAGSIFYLKRHG